MAEPEGTYPPADLLASTEQNAARPDYQDQAARALYEEAGGSKLIGALMKLHKTLSSQAAKLEEFFNTPFSEDNARLIAVTMESIEKVELQLERWHYLIYPNQRPM